MPIYLFVAGARVASERFHFTKGGKAKLLSVSLTAPFQGNAQTRNRSHDARVALLDTPLGRPKLLKSFQPSLFIILNSQMA